MDGHTLADFEKVLSELASEVIAKAQKAPKTQAFDPLQTRDQFLFIADVIELFGALKIGEILELLGLFQMPLPKARVVQMLNLLCLLKVIQMSEHLTRHYFVPPKIHREGFIRYKSKEGTDAKLDRMRFKLNAVNLMKQDSFRRQAYEKVHGSH